MPRQLRKRIVASPEPRKPATTAVERETTAVETATMTVVQATTTVEPATSVISFDSATRKKLQTVKTEQNIRKDLVKGHVTQTWRPSPLKSQYPEC